jgi:hypothetical protein
MIETEEERAERLAKEGERNAEEDTRVFINQPTTNNTMTTETKTAIKFGAFAGGLLGLITGLAIAALMIILG